MESAEMETESSQSSAEGGKNIKKQPSDQAAVTTSGNQAQPDERAHMYVVVAPESLAGSVCGCV